MLIQVSQQIWEAKYRFEPPGGLAERSVEETWARVASAAASVEAPAIRALWERRFLDAMANFAFIPAGRVLAGAGTGRGVTLFNCFVMGGIGDDMGSIFANVREAALTLQQGGGIGHDFSTLQAQGRAGARRGRRCVRPRELHGCLGRDVQDHHVRRLTPRRDDGDLALRSPRYRSLHRGEGRPGAAQEVQSFGACDRRFPGGGEGGRALAARLRRRGLPHVTAHAGFGTRSCAAPTIMPSPE